MSPWKQGRKRVLDEKPVLKYFQRDSDNDYWICKVLLDEDDGDEDDGDEEHCCGAKIKGMGSDSNLGNNLEVKMDVQISNLHDKNWKLKCLTLISYSNFFILFFATEIIYL